MSSEDQNVFTQYPASLPSTIQLLCPCNNLY